MLILIQINFLKFSVMKNKYLLTIDDLKSIKGGDPDVPPVGETDKDCSVCNCFCGEDNIAGFQIGMSINVSQGKLNNPCPLFKAKAN